MCRRTPNKRILVVDDLESKLISVMLERFGGYEVDTAESAQAALALVLHNSYDLFVLDGSMPEMDGFTLAEILRRQGLKRPIIFVTAHMDIVTRPHAEAVGACAVVEKPFEQEELLGAARKALQGDCDDAFTASGLM